MDLIRDSTFFTTLLHCVLATSLHPIHLAQATYNNVSPIPGAGILPTPWYFDKIPETEVSKTPTFMVNPSWHNRHSLDNPDLVTKYEEKINQPLYKPELPGSTLKGIGLKYPLTMPRVKLNFVGNNGMLPVKTVQNTQPTKPELPKVLKPSGPERSTKTDGNDSLNSRVELNNKLKVQSSTPDQQVKPELKLAELDFSPNTASVGHGQVPLNNFQLTPSYKPELPSLYLNPTNFDYPPTDPGIDYSRDREGYKPSYQYQLPGLHPVLNSRAHGNAEESFKNIQYKPDLPEVDVLKSPNFDYRTTNPYLYYDKNNVPEKIQQYIPSQETNVPAIEIPSHSPKKGVNPGLDQPVFPALNKNSHSIGVIKPTMPDKVDNTIELPPVPTTMPLLRRIQLVLLNTVAGLPGGNPQALQAVRA